MKNFLRKLFALLLILFGLFAFVACVTYQVTDSSLNAAGTYGIKNWCGAFGALTADLLLQLFGVMAFVVPIAFIVFGLFLWRRTKWVAFRFLMFLCAFLTAVWLLSDLQTSLDSAWFKAGKGGYVGYFFNRFFVLQSSVYRFIAYGVVVLCLIFSLKVPVMLLSRKAAATVRAVPTDKLKKMVKNVHVKQKATVTASASSAVIERVSDEAETSKAQPEEKRRFLFKKKEKTSPVERVEPSFAFLNGERETPISKTSEIKPTEPVSLQKTRADSNRTSQRTDSDDEATESNVVELPASDLLDPVKISNVQGLSKEAMDTVSRALEKVLAQFNVRGKVEQAHPGPVVTLYEFLPADGIKASRVISLADDIAMKMSVESVRIAVIPGTCYIGIEMPNKQRETVYIREMIENVNFQTNSGALPLILGKDIGGAPVFADLAKMPHLLVAGTTGSGKSVAINTMVLSLLYRFTPAECRMIMVDPKMVELSVYNRIPHLLTPVVVDPEKAVVALKWAVREMEDRYRSMSQLGVRNISGYNQKLAEAAREGKELTRRVQTGFDPETGRPIFEEQQFDLTPIPYIVIIVDEMADLMGRCGKEVDPLIQRLAQMARAVGIHLILATQRPSVDVITGTIKSNFPSRMSFQVRSKIDSRTILDEPGAERLLGKGDMLFMPAGSAPQRVHGPFVSDNDVERVVHHWEMQAEPEYVEAVTADPDAANDSADIGFNGTGESESGDLYDKAVAVVLRDKRPTISYVQRVFGIGYNKAADLMDRMEAEGVVSKPSSTGKREIIVPTDNA